MAFLKYLGILLLCLTLANCATKDIPGEMGFVILDPNATGIKFENHVDENEQNYVAHFNYVYNGGGVAIGDINNDGLSDIYFTGNEVLNKLYLNKGNLRFEDITGRAGVDGGNGWHNGVNMVDINMDGHLDIYISRGGWNDTDAERANLLYINNGDLTFREEAEKYGLADIGYSIQSVFLDIDNDQDLDMYLSNRPALFYLTPDEVSQGEAANSDLSRDKLYLNDNGHYKEIGLKAGIVNNYGYGLGVAAADINNDGYTDIYVTNDYQQHDYLYINQRDGTFKESIRSATNHTSFYSMGLDIMDINNDGHEDIFTLDMLPEDYIRSKTTMASMNVAAYQDLIDRGHHYQYMHNMLQLNQGNGFFSEVAQLAGLAKTDWSWSCINSDFDNDGHKDVFVTNGYRRDVTNKDATKKFEEYLSNTALEENSPQQNIQNILSLYDENRLTNYIFQNDGNLSFSNKSHDWKVAGSRSFSNGAAVGDLDNDGDLDIVINNLESTAQVLENQADKTYNRYLKVRLIGPAANPYGLGAKLTITYDDGRLQYQEMKTTRGYLSSMEPIAHFGVGDHRKVKELKVEWKGNRATIIQHLRTNRLVEVHYSNNHEKGDPISLSDPLLVEETNERFSSGFNHRENAYDDYATQVLLPHQLSRLGPFAAVGDINNDGLDDFFVGGASGQSGAIYEQSPDGTFDAMDITALQVDKTHEDMGATFLDIDSDGDQDLYVVSGGQEWPAGSHHYQDRLYLNDGNGTFTKTKIPTISSSGSCVVPSDYDKDGDVDLFVGARLTPGQYPKSGQSYLLENEGGQLRDVTDSRAPILKDLGMVSSAVWMDMDDDDQEELIVVGEWMPITVLAWNGDKLENQTDDYGLSLTRGWWNSVIKTDIDNDADMDLVLGNLGENYKFKASPEVPFYVYADDFDDNGTNDIFLAKTYKDKIVPIRGKECSSQQLPVISENFPTYQKFAEAGLPQIIGDRIATALTYEAQVFSSGVLKNNEGEYVFERLPVTAQFSVVNGIVSHDLSGDGIEDLLLAGNNFNVEIETTRSDASPGLVLVPSDNSSMRSLPLAESGLFVPYNVRDVKKIRLADGAIGFLITANDDILRLYVHHTGESSNHLSSLQR